MLSLPMMSMGSACMRTCFSCACNVVHVSVVQSNHCVHALLCMPAFYALSVDSCVLSILSALHKSVMYCAINLMHADAVLRQQGRKVHAGYTSDLPAVWARPRKPSQLAVTASQQHRCCDLQHQKVHVSCKHCLPALCMLEDAVGSIKHTPMALYRLQNVAGFRTLPGVFASY
jgi:hypothetical protein